jgi:outer membrane protein TolC
LPVARISARAQRLEARQQMQALSNQAADLEAELNDLMGLPLETRLRLAPPEEPLVVPALESRLSKALDDNPEIRAAMQAVEKAKQGVAAAKADYIPDLGAFAQYTYQNGVPLLAQNNGVFGLKMELKLFDGGKRKGVVQEREALLAQADANLERVRNRVRVDIEKSYRRVIQAGDMVAVAREAAEARREARRIASDQFESGVIVLARYEEAKWESARSDAGVLQAEWAYRMAMAELDRAAGVIY